MKLNNSQYKSSDNETKVLISLFYAPLNGQPIPCNNLALGQGIGGFAHAAVSCEFISQT